MRFRRPRERAAGFRRALAEAGLACAGVAQGDYTVESGRACMEELLEMGVDAVFAANHELTVGALSVARGRDVRVIGFDGMELQALCGERLLSLSQPMEATAAPRRAVDGADSNAGRAREVRAAPALRMAGWIKRWVSR